MSNKIDRAEFRRLWYSYPERPSAARIARDMGLSQTTVRILARELGLGSFGQEPRPQARLDLTPEAVRDALIEHGSVEGAAKALNTSRKTLNYRIVEYGLDHLRLTGRDGGVWVDKETGQRLTLRTLVKLHEQEGDWRSVAQRLGVKIGALIEGLRKLREYESDTTNLNSGVESEPEPWRVVQGAAGVVQAGIADWSLEMGMEPTEASQALPFDLELIQEEVDELREAIETEDRVAQLDALADIAYTVFNIAFRRNLPVAQALGEVHRSNCTKTPNGDGKPTKGDSYSPPDLVSVLRRFDNYRKGGKQ